MSAHAFSVLGLDPTATFKDVTTAYRRLSLQTHPDKATNDEERMLFQGAFIMLKSAYDQLKLYFEGKQKDESSRKGRDGSMPPAFIRTLPTISVEINVPLSFLFIGGSHKVSFDRQMCCPTCCGLGYTDPMKVNCTTCSVCYGKGLVQDGKEFCKMCGSLGYVAGMGRCNQCRGRGSVSEKHTITIEIPKGCPDGHEVDGGSNGHNVRSSLTTGRVAVKVFVAEDPWFSRHNADLLIKRKLSLPHALCGIPFTLTLPNNETITVAPPEGVGMFKAGQVLCVLGKGLPKLGHSTFGDLWVHITVDMSCSLKLHQQQRLAQLFELSEIEAMGCRGSPEDRAIDSTRSVDPVIKERFYDLQQQQQQKKG